MFGAAFPIKNLFTACTEPLAVAANTILLPFVVVRFDEPDTIINSPF